MHAVRCRSMKHVTEQMSGCNMRMCLGLTAIVSHGQLHIPEVKCPLVTLVKTLTTEKGVYIPSNCMEKRTNA